jgi:hypothetical protein
MARPPGIVCARGEGVERRELVRRVGEACLFDEFTAA